ncbi:MAG: prkC 37 [Gemmataceae bacterium]|nr:prkC 37 [Gemmataceae bacterium]
MISNAGRSRRLPSSTRYEFYEPVGTGGAGTVYRACDRQTGQLVAVKVLHVRLSENPVLHRRLALEFRAASGLEHPNIVRALAADTDGETSYLVYELVEAGSLGARIEKHGRLPADVAIRIITQIAQALHYAHERQVVHRDVKPDNILLLPDGKAKLTDFGLAKDYTDASQDLTRHASGLGTPNFMAPEQFANAKTADARCDVYSLAATLYNAVTGRLPFDAKSPLAILTNKELFRLPPARSLAPELSERADAAIRAALDPNPDRRPASCLEFFKRLAGRRRVKDGSTPKEVPVPPGGERRTSPRFAVEVGSCAVADPGVHPGGVEEAWPLVVRDVSAGGIGVLLARRFEPGTALAIELAGEAGGQPVRLPVRVVRVDAERAGHWIHGCTFAGPLTAGQLRALHQFA